jgi:hypothetical protein
MADKKTSDQNTSGTGGTDFHTCLNTGNSIITDTNKGKGLESHTQNNKPSVQKDERLRKKAEEDYQQEL